VTEAEAGPPVGLPAGTAKAVLASATAAEITKKKCMMSLSVVVL